MVRMRLKGSQLSGWCLGKKKEDEGDVDVGSEEGSIEDSLEHTDIRSTSVC